MQKKWTLTHSIARARHAWVSHVRKIALEEGVPDSYRQIIMFLCRNPGSSQRNIAEFAGITTSAISQTVKSMQEEGYLHKEADPFDKRNFRLYLTDKGESVAKNLFARIDASDDAITAMIGAEKEAELIALLDQLTDYIRKDLL